MRERTMQVSTPWSTLPPGAGRDRMMRVFLVAGVVVSAFFCIEHDVTASAPSGFSLSVDEKVADVESGNPRRQLAVAGLGVAGLLMLAMPGARRLRGRGLLSVFWVALLLWCASSVLWAEDTALSWRRLVAAVCLVIAGVAMAQRLTIRELGWVVVVSCSAVLLSGLVVELALGHFRPTHPYYRFAGTNHPNNSGLVAATLVAAALCFSRLSARRGRWLVALAVIALAFLLLTRSRASLGALLLAQAAFWVLGPMTPRKAFRGLGLVWLSSLGAVLMGSRLFEVVFGVALLGRVDSDAATLSGRTLLWQELLPVAEMRPWLGYGYGSFWTSDRIDDLAMPEWAVSAAHSVYLDVLLSLGTVGLVLITAVLVLGIRRAAILHRREPMGGYGFLCTFLLLALFHGLMESKFYSLGLVPFMAFVGLTVLAFGGAEPLSVPRFGNLGRLKPATVSSMHVVGQEAG